MEFCEPFQLRTPFSMIVAGSSGSGKTTFCRHIPEIMKQPPVEVVWFGPCWQTAYEDMPYPTRFVNTLPKPQELKEDSLLVVDDGMDVVPKVEKYFTQYCHHQKCNLVLILQNLFLKNLRTCSLNCSHMVVFSGVRNQGQVTYLGRQLFPNNPRFLPLAYEDACKNPFAYLMLDFTQETPERHRIRTNILPNDIGHQIIYAPL